MCDGRWAARERSTLIRHIAQVQEQSNHADEVLAKLISVLMSKA